MNRTDTIRIVPRMEYAGSAGKWEPILFLPDSRRDSLIGCYSHIGQHSEAHLDYYRDTRAPKAGECDALLREYASIPPASARLTVLRRLPSA
jgi:hypothetical protein